MAYLICTILVTVLVCLDQNTKYIFLNPPYQLYESVTFIKGLFNIHPCYNTGAAWSMLNNHPVLLQIVSVLGVTLLIYLLKDFRLKRRPFYSYGLVLALAGTVGNMIDRIFSKNGVADFIQFAFWTDYPTFNLADSFLCIGVVMICIHLVFFESKDPIKVLPEWMKRKKKETSEGNDDE